MTTGITKATAVLEMGREGRKIDVACCNGPTPHGIPPVDTTTRSEAWAIGDGSVVVLIAGKSGGVCLSHVEVLP